MDDINIECAFTYDCKDYKKKCDGCKQNLALEVNKATYFTPIKKAKKGFWR